MPTLRKAARGKRRWVGVKIDRERIDEKTFSRLLASHPGEGKPRLAWSSEDGRYLILEVRLEHYPKTLDDIDQLVGAESLTSSGKIRLVKSRIMGLSGKI